MHSSYCRQGLGHLEATGTFTSSSSATLHPRPRVRRACRVLYPPHQSRRPPVREDPDQAWRWLLLLSALVLLQIFTEETHTCPGRIKSIIETALVIINLCLLCNLGLSAFFFLIKKKPHDFCCWLAGPQSQRPSVVSPQSQEGDGSLGTAQACMGRRGILEGSAWDCTIRNSVAVHGGLMEEHLKYFMFRRPKQESFASAWCSRNNA